MPRNIQDLELLYQNPKIKLPKKAKGKCGFMLGWNACIEEVKKLNK